MTLYAMGFVALPPGRVAECAAHEVATFHNNILRTFKVFQAARRSAARLA